MNRIAVIFICLFICLFSAGCSSSAVVEVTSANFDNVVAKSKQPVLVDCWASWCGPCKVLAPTIEELADDYKGSVTVGKLDVDDNPDLARQFGITAIPTVLLFKDGEVVARHTGVQPKGNYVADIKKILGE